MTEYISYLIAIVCALSVLISVITEFTKNLGFLKKIPTNLQVLGLSLITCLTTYFAGVAYFNIPIVWYHIVAVFYGSFVVALVTTKGWKYFIEIINRYKYPKDSE